jgi:predicted nucleic acid-binding protein
LLIYVGSSVILAQLLGEDLHPEASFWERRPLVASRLLEYEVSRRIHSRDLAMTHGEAVEEVLGRVSFLELAPIVLGRALDPFPAPVRTLDALHLATIDFLRNQGQRPRLATYDRRLAEAAAALNIPLVDWGEG